jgi:pimeloyl-ACP methyl ester carboxylesterase
MRPALVLLPGMDGTGELFDPLLQFLTPQVEPIIVRYPDRPASYAQHADFARREVPKDRPVVLLGESFSGPVAVSIAAGAPPKLRAVILCASFVTCPHLLLGYLRGFTAFASPKLVPDFITRHALMGRFATPELRAAHTRALSRVSSPTLTARLRAMADIDVREELRSLAVPLLYLRATSDRLVPRRSGDEVAACAAEARIIEVDGPHFLLQTQPLESARHIAEFVENCVGRRLA